ncbi:Crp/Fnr family transcriptional regulator [Roseivirga sp.]|uniref:Crp/Fnr family transcriptional regulator n=1 Tax=Roseivirga sp. TaxID=1964215 RepID=UPI003B5163C0
MDHPLKKHIEEITPISEEDFDYLLGHFSIVTKRKHQYIVQQGEPVDKEYWVVKGLVKSYFVDHAGKEHILMFGMENWWVTDYDAFTNQSEAKISVDCLEDCELLCIDFQNKEKLLREMPLWNKFWAYKTKQGYISLQNRVLSLLKNTAQERYETLYREYPQLFQHVPKKLLAAYLGVSRETLSRFQS